MVRPFISLDFTKEIFKLLLVAKGPVNGNAIPERNQPVLSFAYHYPNPYLSGFFK